jgi:hypothetical protein
MTDTTITRYRYDTVRDHYRDQLARSVRLMACIDHEYGNDSWYSGPVSGIWIPDCLYESSPHHVYQESL